MEEQWLPWAALTAFNEIFYVDKTSHNSKGVEIILSNEKNTKRMQIKFSHKVKAYRATYETFRCNLTEELNTKYNQFPSNHNFFFIVKNSQFIQWISQESNYSIDTLSLIHYLIFTQDDIIDIVDNSEPIIQSLSEGQVS